ncbi:hypothetical protein DdX_08107 [Ditylenchus destructor]|uniref:Uncharacterized protein n=1 Tax=Ditylenchus destructor TaxID=166010 RepID=A0AAD4N6N6_9BILA|nr:hypothetical protein DdX_08107 [Ditylenchus destructor]
MLIWRRRLTILLSLFISVLVLVKGDNQEDASATRQPVDSFATGKLNQFKGFYTPRPLPPNAQFTFASVWAAWSAWSFCANGAQMRVRACNTVRGFSCLGPNMETKPCGTLTQDSDRSHAQVQINTDLEGRDYEAVDPWFEDRREALRQLSPKAKNSGQASKSDKKPMSSKEFLQRSAGKTVQGMGQRSPGVPNYGGNGNGLVGPPRRASAVQNYEGPPRAPSMTPELLFGSKLEVPDTPINSSEGIEKSEELGDSFTTTTVSGPLPGSTVSSLVLMDQNKPNQDSTLQKSDPVIGNPGEGLDEIDLWLATSSKGSTSSTLPPSTTTTTEPVPAFSITDEMETASESTKTTTMEIVRTTMAETQMPEQTDLMSTEIQTEKPEPVPVTPSRGTNWAKNQGWIARPEPGRLHSGEVVFPKKQEDRISTDTAKALEWMLANMTKAAERELQEQRKIVEGGKDSKPERLHSGESRIPRLNANANPLPLAIISEEFRGDHNNINRKAFGIKSYGNDSVKIHSLSPFDRRKEFLQKNANPPRATAETLMPADVSNEKSAANPENDAELREALSMQKDLASLHTIMRHIENEIKALKPDAASENPIQNGAKTNTFEPTHSIQGDRMVVNPKAWEADFLMPSTPKPRQSTPPPMAQTTVDLDNVELTKLLLVEGGVEKQTEAKWSDWRPWAECFCNRQVRTRVCVYDNAYNSKGCQGRSYESRPCITHRPCPQSRLQTVKPVTMESSTAGYYTLAPARGPRQRPDPRFLRPHPLAVARHSNPSKHFLLKKLT